MEGTVGDHFHVAAPAVEGADDAPGARLGISGIRVDHDGLRLDDLRRLVLRIQEQIVGAVLGDDDIAAALRHGEVLAQHIGLDTLGIAEVHVPAGVLAELEFVTGRQGDVLAHMEGTVGNHFHVAAPAVEGADDAPRALLRIGGVRVLLRHDALDDLRRRVLRIQDEVVRAGLGDHDVAAALGHFEFFAQRVGAHAFGITEVNIPGAILAELHLRTGFQLDGLRHVQGAVRPHLVIAAPAVERTDQAPVTLLRVPGIRVAAGQDDLVTVNDDVAEGFDEGSGVLVVRRLQVRGPDGHFQGMHGPFLAAQFLQGAGQVGGRDGQDSVLVRRVHTLAHGFPVEGNDRQHVIQDLGVGVEDGRGVLSRYGAIHHRVPDKHRCSALGGVEDGSVLVLHAGDQAQ